DRGRLLDALAALEGVYVPSRYEIVYAPDGTVGDVLPQGATPAIVTKRRLRNVDAFETVDAVKTPNAEYGHMALLEVGKGCGRGCRFCLEGQVYRPVRHRSLDAPRENLARAHVTPNLKTYFMIGQPTETLEDVEAIPRLAERMLERLSVPDPNAKPFGRLTLSISSFVPKPWTPFQWAPFAGAEALQAKLEIVKRGARRLHNVRVLHENPREAALQALLARGDRRVADFLELAASFAGDWRRALREWKGDPDFCTTRVRSTDERLPWDHFDVGVKKAGLI